MTRWQRYWYADGGRIAAAFVRVAIALAALLSLDRLATLSTVELPGPVELYRPVGPWMLLGHVVPPDWAITALWVMAWVGGAAMLIGLCTRVATVVSFVGTVALAALSYAASAHWSHPYNVVLLAQLAFLGARGGDALSVDAWLRRRRGLGPIDVARGYQWSLRLVQLAIALMFAGAAFHKILHGRFTLDWALSDNLRHHLLVRYDLADLDRPALVDWLLASAWRYRTAAMLNLVAQLTPIFACIFVRRPLIRALCGAVFACEVLGLGLVVSLWNLHWLPLCAAFVDWDRLNDRLTRQAPAPATPERRPARRVRIWIAVFVIYEAITSFVPGLDQRLNTYPFSGFPMFATIRAARPYDEHLPYGTPGDVFEVTSDVPLAPVEQRWFDHANRGVHEITDPDKLERRLRAILETARRRYPDRGIRGVRHYLAIFEVPAYPAPAHFEAHRVGVTGEITPDGTFRTVLGRLADDHVELRPRGVALTNARLAYYANDRSERHGLGGTRTGDRFAIATPADDPLYVVAIDEADVAARGDIPPREQAVPWLVAVRRSWRWQ